MSRTHRADPRAPRLAMALGAIVLAGTAVLWYLTTRIELPTGFSARYFTGVEWAGQPARTATDERVSTAIVSARWPNTREPFSVRWDAALRIETSGTYRLSVLSDDGAWLYVNNRLIVDNGGTHGIRQATVSVQLERGVHAMRLDYVQAGEDFRVELLWSPRASGPLTPLIGGAVSPTARTRSDYRLGRARDIVRVVIVGVWAIAYWFLGSRFVLMPLGRSLVRHHAPGGLPFGVIAWLALVTVLYGAGITWGSPGPGWVPNELAPAEVFDATARWFSGGWWSWYGPVHYYLLALVSFPLSLWRWLDGDAFHAHLGPDLLVVVFRVVSVAMSVTIVLMMYVCGVYVARATPTPDTKRFEWPAFVAMAIGSLSLPMVFYAKTANMDVPYLFWFSLSLASLARIAADGSTRDYVLFAVTGMLAVCTKDQAYGLFGLPALGVAVHAYRRMPGASVSAKLSSLARDRWVWAAVVAGIGTFVLAQNLITNASGFLAHFRYIQTGGIDGFRMFGMSVDGIWQLWRASWMLIRVSVGWPAFVLILAGLVLSTLSWHPRLWWMLLPAISYFVTYAVVVRYTYDRFLLPVLLMLALAAGVAAAQVEVLARGRRWTRLIAGGVIAYTLVYVVAVDAAMVGDSRYAAERWLRANAEPGARIGLVGGAEYMPRIDGFAGQMMRPTPGDMESASFDYIVLNLDWVKRFPADRLEHQLFASLQANHYAFRPVFHAGADTRLAGVRFLDRFAAFGDVGYSTLTKIDPPLVIFKRIPGL